MEDDFNNYFNGLMKLHGIETRAFSELSGCAESTIRKWKNGVTVPGHSFLLKIKTALGLTEKEYLVLLSKAQHSILYRWKQT